MKSPIMALITFTTLLILTAGCREKKTETVPGNNKIPSISADTSAADTSSKTSEAAASDKNIVRQGIIDLKAIDQNNDGKVYQCPMDFNVIDDKANTCPACKMDLEEVSLKKAKDNLKAGDFQVK